jgi:predicted transcriptional regulator
MNILHLFHNTTNLEHKELSKEIGNAYKQDRRIIELFRREKRPLDSHTVERLLDNRFCRSSVVRSVNTLTRQGFLRKTDMMVIGEYGKKVHLWALIIK